MKTKKSFSILMFFLCISTYAFSYEERNLLQKTATIDEIKNVLVMDQKWVKYPKYEDRAGWDKFFGDYKSQYIKAGEEALDYDWKVIRASWYLEYVRSGNRMIMQYPLDDNHNAITKLFFAELAEGKGRFIDQLINGVIASCEMTTWSLSAHLNAQSSKNMFPDHRENIIDLGVGNHASQMAWIYFLMKPAFDKVNPLISIRLRDELQKRMLDPYMQRNDFWWMAINWEPGILVNNWNTWCNFNAIQCFFLLENDKDKLAEAVYKSMVSVDKFINYTQADGGCEEGPSYWPHAAGKLYDYLQMLYDGTGGMISIFDNKMIKDMGEYIVRSYIGNGWVVNFADAEAKNIADYGVIYRYGKAVNSELMKNFAAYIASISETTIPLHNDYFRSMQMIKDRDEFINVEPNYTKPSYSWYPTTQFCYMTNKNGFFLAAKGGNNNESHNHNDVGSFSLYLDETPVFIDAGTGTYRRQTFSSERYTLWMMQSQYHNLPIINGIMQKNGEEYKAKDSKFDLNKMTFSTDISGAYPEEANVEKWIRSYKLENNALKIIDNFTLKDTIEKNKINFLLWNDADISTPGKVIINSNIGKVTLLYDKNKLSPSVETINLDDPRFTKIWGEKIYRLSLTAKDMAKTGTYNYIITK